MNKNNIIITTLLVVLAFLVYSNYQKTDSDYLKSEKRSNLTFERKMECQTAGEKIYQKHITDGSELRYFNPQYKYSKNLDTCLYYGGYFGDSEGNIQKWVIDSLTNEELISYMQVDGKPFTAYCDSCRATVQDFDLEKERLFNE